MRPVATALGLAPVPAGARWTRSGPDILTVIDQCPHAPASPPPLSPAFGAWLRSAKRDLLAGDESRPMVIQPGAAQLDGPFPLPAPSGLAIDRVVVGEEPLIETFMVEAGRCTGTGGDRALIEAWQPVVEQLVDRVVAAMQDQGVVLDGPVSVTASLTATERVATSAHVDDDQYVEGDGVGLVAIVASQCGPRMATDPVAVCGPIPGPPRSGLPIQLDPETIERFESGATPYQQAEPGRIVVLPQFGQLHAGPVIDPSTSDPIRSLLVLRARTRPNPA